MVMANNGSARLILTLVIVAVVSKIWSNSAQPTGKQVGEVVNDH